ncbi:MAG: hypothetical protein NZ551_08830 [Microscillaceae bacterium]|nr:hypothetical protein [Microscillaceae bacterium]MDW8461304.1 hypothetical protein [Cytophagales bacterium]
MKKLSIFLALLSIMYFHIASAQNNNRPVVTIKSLPNSTDEFISLRNQIATTPEGGAAMFILALYLYTKKPTMGMECIISSVDMSVLSEAPEGKGYKGYDLGSSNKSLLTSQLDKGKHIPSSYFKGTSPQNGYKASTPFQVETSTNPSSGNESEGKIKLFVKSTGADSPRPIMMKQNDKGIWKASEWSSLLVGVRPPATTVKDDL